MQKLCVLSYVTFCVSLWSIPKHVFMHEPSFQLSYIPFKGATVAGFPARPQVGKLVVACRWSAVYGTEL